MNEDIKPKFKEYLIAPIVIVILLILMFFFYYKWNESVKQHNNYVQTINDEKTKGEINAPSESVVAKENTLYPKINANIAQINKDVKSLNETILRLEKNQINKEQINEKFKNENAKQISEYFISNEYPNTVISGK